MHLALYRKWRPMVFNDVIGQEHITNVLQYEVEHGKTSHAYLFCGSRGTGKTTCAKILAKAVNCISPVNGNPCCKCDYCKAIEAGTTTDVLEMDAASNTGVDYIRDIRDEVVYAPSLVKNRVYIIDEVHMLSDSAFNALLKTLEEPPANVIFILATTERQKIPATILSRCQKFDFKRISSDNIAKRLTYIGQNEGISVDNDAARFIAGLCNGGMRDSISMLELVCSDGKDKNVTVEKVSKVAGVIGRDVCAKTVEAVIGRKHKEIFNIMSDIYYSSYDISAFWLELMKYYRDLLVVSVFSNQKEDPSKELLDLTSNEYDKLKEIATRTSYSLLMYQAGLLEEAYVNSIGKQGSDKRVSAEMTLLKMSEPSSSYSIDGLASRLSTLEAKIASGGFSIKQPPKQDTTPSDVSIKKPDNEQITSNDIAAEITKSELIADKQAVEEWSEIFSLYRAADSASAPYLDSAEVYLDSASNLNIVLSNDFSKTMLEIANADKALYNIALDRGVFVDRVKFSVKPKEKKKSDFDFEI